MSNRGSGHKSKDDARKRREEMELLRRYAEKRDPATRERLVERFIPLARSLALRYRNGGEPTEDLIQVANLGLLKAIDRFEPERRSNFVAFAAPTILGELRHYFRDHSWSVRLPRSLQERSMRIAEVSAEIRAETQGAPRLAAVATRCNLSEDEVIEAMQAEEARRTTSLDRPTARDEEESAPVIETIGREDMGYERAESELASERAELRPKEREALHLRFHEGLTQREIGARIGVSQMQISRLLRSGLNKLLEAVRGGEKIDPAIVLRDVNADADDRRTVSDQTA